MVPTTSIMMAPFTIFGSTRLQDLGDMHCKGLAERISKTHTTSEILGGTSGAFSSL